MPDPADTCTICGHERQQSGGHCDVVTFTPEGEMRLCPCHYSGCVYGPVDSGVLHPLPGPRDA